MNRRLLLLLGLVAALAAAWIASSGNGHTTGGDTEDARGRSAGDRSPGALDAVAEEPSSEGQRVPAASSPVEPWRVVVLASRDRRWRPVLQINSKGEVQSTAKAAPHWASGLEFELFLDDAARTPLASGVLGDDGRAELALADGRITVDERGRFNVAGVLLGDGLQRRVGRAGASVKEPRTMHIYLTAVEGVTQRFLVPGYRVERKDGDVVGFAAGTVSDPFGEEHEGNRSVTGCVALPGLAGEIDVHFPKGKDIDLVHFDAGALGNATLALRDDGRALPADRPTELELQGSARLHGRLVRGDGEGAVGIQLRLRPAVGPDELAPQPEDEPAASEIRARGAGQRFQVTFSDERGAFEFTGLVPGDYVIAAPSGERDDWNLQHFTDLATCRASEDPAALQLCFAQPTVVVEVAASYPWPLEFDAPVLIEIFDAGADGEPVWARATSLDPMGSETRPIDRWTLRDLQVSNGVSIPVPAGRQFLVKASAPGAVTAVAAVRPAARGGMDRAEVVLVPALPRGEIEVELFVEDELLPPAPNVGVTVTDIATGLVVACRHGTNKVPPGTYRVSAFGLHEFGGHHGGLMTRRMHGRASSVVEVASGARVSTRLDIPPGGRLEIEVLGSVSSTEREQAVWDQAVYEARRSDRTLPRSQEVARQMLHDPWRVDLFDAELILESESEAYSTPLFRSVFSTVEDVLGDLGGAPVRSSEPYMVDASRWWPIGETHTSTLLPEGAFTLRARVHGRPDVTIPVEIVSGETRRVSLDLGNSRR